MPSTQSNEWGMLLLILLNKKDIFFSGRNRLPFLVTMKIQPKFRWSESIKVNLLLKAEEPSLLIARVLCMSTVFQNEREVHLNILLS